MVADVLSKALDELARARANVVKTAHRQIRSQEQRAALRALAFAWFQSHRKGLATFVEPTAIIAADVAYRTILDAAEKNSARKTYLDAMAAAKSALIGLRGLAVITEGGDSSDDAVPDFSPLASDSAMRGILGRRWEECRRCIAADAPLAAVVMMGGLLEALFVARANRLTDKSPLFKASSVPLDPKTKKPLDLREWTLRPYLDVAHEIGWITRSAKDVAAVLRDYRNYVHPEKERSHGVVLRSDDSRMLWQVAKALARQLLTSVSSGA